MKINYAKLFTNKWLINSTAMVLTAAFLLLFYFFYLQYQGYDMIKKSKIKPAPLTVKTPQLLSDFPGRKIDVFSKTRGVKAVPEKKEPPKPLEFDIIGIVKLDKLYAVVEFKKTNKIKVFEEGKTIDGNILIEKIENDKVTILNNNQKKEIKLFTEKKEDSMGKPTDSGTLPDNPYHQFRPAGQNTPGNIIPPTREEPRFNPRHPNPDERLRQPIMPPRKRDDNKDNDLNREIE
jgi:type II secretory pathway component PulC